MPELTINGRTFEAPPETNLLQAIRQAGEHLPTLCHWEGLPPYGACRLCLVEVERPGAVTGETEAAVVAACTYPAADGLVVDTHGPQATAVRRMMLEFMLARCPNSETIQQLAAEAGVSQTRFPVNENADELCILCGLCVRVCRDLVGAAAISFIDRGAERMVGAPFQLQSEACIGCAACAAVCPTGAVSIEDVDGQRVLRTWNTTVPLHRCPECGQPYAPEPMAFLKGLVPVSAERWGMCPKCRRQTTAAQLEVVRL
ncbi:MAG: 2Fe-2S iron-sulfur cluster-binding protein [Chloroflexota bacterium]|jgi:NADH dehydrogenase/NADH:ubiquinone oxidoreductase subunit G